MSAALRPDPQHPDASLYAALAARGQGGEADSAIRLVEELSAATRGLGEALSRGGVELAELGDGISPRLRQRLRGLLFAVEAAAARQQAAVGALALHLSRSGAGHR